MIREALPTVALSTDIIVGFPGETEEQFQETLSLIEQVGFDGIFAFKYSPRPFTKSALWKDSLSEEEKSKRLERLFALQRPIALSASQKSLGQIQEVLIEEMDLEQGLCRGRNSENRSVEFESKNKKRGELARVQITQTRPSLYKGVLV